MDFSLQLNPQNRKSTISESIQNRRYSDVRSVNYFTEIKTMSFDNNINTLDCKNFLVLYILNVFSFFYFNYLNINLPFYFSIKCTLDLLYLRICILVYITILL